MKVAILVVTYNRIKLLLENIDAILKQNYEAFDFYICNNASTDNTEETVLEKAKKDSRIKYYNTGDNLGGAGGFAFGLNIILRKNYDYAWIMDDDSIPEPDSLQELLNAAELIGKDNFSFLASKVLWTDGNDCFMNKCIPTPDEIPEELKNNELLPIHFASFVGCFINTDYAKKVGLPIKEFFIYGDDGEYTLRLHEQAPAYWCLKSVIIHKMPSNARIGIAESEVERLDRYKYEYRNRIYIYKYRFKYSLMRIKKIYFKECVKVFIRAKNNRFKRIKIIINGYKEGKSFNPEIQKIN